MDDYSLGNGEGYAHTWMITRQVLYIYICIFVAIVVDTYGLNAERSYLETDPFLTDKRHSSLQGVVVVVDTVVFPSFTSVRHLRWLFD